MTTTNDLIATLNALSVVASKLANYDSHFSVIANASKRMADLKASGMNDSDVFDTLANEGYLTKEQLELLR